MIKYSHRIGAVFYMLWGLLHIGSGFYLLYILLTAGGTDALAIIGDAVPRVSLPQHFDGVALGVLEQHAWNLAVFGFFSLYVGARLNWINSKLGYWLNLMVVSGADIGFIFAIMVPGYISFLSGMLGPALWILAITFSTIGIRSQETS